MDISVEPVAPQKKVASQQASAPQNISIPPKKPQKDTVPEVKEDKVNKKEEEKSPADKTKAGRTLTSQEESILLPLIQGLIAAGGGKPNEQIAKAKTKTKTSKQEKKASRAKKSVKLSDTEQSVKSK